MRRLTPTASHAYSLAHRTVRLLARRQFGIVRISGSRWVRRNQRNRIGGAGTHCCVAASLDKGLTMYDPGTARWMSKDPMGLDAGSPNATSTWGVGRQCCETQVASPLFAVISELALGSRRSLSSSTAHLAVVHFPVVVTVRRDGGVLGKLWMLLLALAGQSQIQGALRQRHVMWRELGQFVQFQNQTRFQKKFRLQGLHVVR